MEHPRGRRIRVLFVDNSFTFGGAIQSLSEVTRYLPAHRVDPIVVSGQPEEVLSRLFPDVPRYSVQFPLPWIDGDPFLGPDRTREASELGPVMRWTRSLYWAFRGELNQAATITRIAMRHRADIIHLNNSARSQTGGALAARALGIPCISHMRGSFNGAWRSNRLRMAVPHHHVAISDAVEATLLNTGLPKDRISVIHNAVDVEVFQPAPAKSGLRESVGLTPSSKVIGVFGRIVPFKGILEYLRAFALVTARGVDVQTLVVGDPSDGPVDYLREVHGLARELGLSERVLFTGFRSDIPDLLRLCDIVAMPSVGEEGFGRTLVEAMAVGVPVVASDYGGPLDVVRDGVDGLLRDPNDPRSFAQAMTSLIEDDRMRRAMGLAGRRRVLDTFSSTAQAAKLARLYRNVQKR